MIIDFRHHISSLVAVFVALGVGIFIGSMLIGNGLNDKITEHQQQMVSLLEADYTQIKKQNKEKQMEIEELTDDLLFYKNFAEEIFPSVVTNSLSDYKLAIIEFDKESSYSALVEKLEKAGSNVVSITSFLDGVEGIEKEPSHTILSLMPKDEVLSATTSLANTVGELLLVGENEEIITELKQLELVSKMGSYGSKLDGVIFIMGKNTTKTKFLIEQKLINYLVSHGLPVYIVSDSTNRDVMWNNYHKFSITIIENIDTIPGQTALIMALSDKRRQGHFGVSALAQSILPTIN